MMRPLRARGFNGRCACMLSAPASSAWMPPDFGLRLISWIHATLHAVAVIAWNPKNQKNRSCLPPTWRHARNWANVPPANASLAASSSFFIDNVPPCGVGRPSPGRSRFPYTASIIVGLAAKPAGRPDLIRSRHSGPGSLVGGLMS